eukprot:679735-Amphidinium_carterae.1
MEHCGIENDRGTESAELHDAIGSQNCKSVPIAPKAQVEARPLVGVPVPLSARRHTDKHRGEAEIRATHSCDKLR